MAAPEKADRTVFVGNIPYDLSEELIVETLSRVGQVLSFRLVHDRETGNPKGFGFAEYPDHDSAASAIRNLNDYELAGRKLRVDWSNEGASGGGNRNQQQQQHQQQHQMHQQHQQNTMAGASNGNPQDPAAALPQLPPGADIPPDLTCPDAISRTLKTLPPPQLLDILSQMKGLVTTEPAKATELLRQAPQLSYAIFQSLLLLGLVDTSTLAAVVEQATAAQAAPAPMPPVAAPPPQPAGGYGGYPSQPTPVQQPYAQPQAQQIPPQGKEQLLHMVMNLTPQQIEALGPAERQQILQLRNQIMSGQF